MNYDNLKLRSVIADKIYSDSGIIDSGIAQCRILVYSGIQPTWDEYVTNYNTKYSYSTRETSGNHLLASIGDFAISETSENNIDLELSNFTIYLDPGVENTFTKLTYSPQTVDGNGDPDTTATWAVVLYDVTEDLTSAPIIAMIVPITGNDGNGVLKLDTVNLLQNQAFDVTDFSFSVNLL